MKDVALPDPEPDPEPEPDPMSNQFRFTLPESNTIRITCVPPASVTDLCTVIHDCQPPVGSTKIWPLVLVPLTSRWKLPPFCVATRNEAV